MGSETCPKCERPRLADSLDCPYCGIVYDRYRGDRLPAGAARGDDEPAPQPPPPPPAIATTTVPASPTSHLPDLYDGPAPAAAAALARSPGEAPPEATAAADGTVEQVETFFTRHLVLCLVVAALLYAALYGFWTRQLFAHWQNPELARAHFTELSGFAAPQGLDDGSVWNLAGRHMVLLEEADEPEDRLALTAFVFHPGSLGGDVGEDALLRGVEQRIDLLGVPYASLGDRRLELRGAPARNRTYLLGSERRVIGRVSALTFRAPDGRQALLVVLGTPDAVARLMSGYLL